MSQSIYHVTMSDRIMRHIKGLSAVEAMSKALDRNRGLTILACFTGNVDMTLSEAGRITYDVPPHQPLPPHEPEQETK